jgi:hypothetical protein
MLDEELAGVEHGRRGRQGDDPLDHDLCFIGSSK